MARRPDVIKRKAERENAPTLVEQAVKASSPQYRNWSTRLPADLVERVWGTTAAEAGPGDRPSLVAFTVAAFEHYLDHLDREAGRTEPVYADKSPFKAGGHNTYSLKR